MEYWILGVVLAVAFLIGVWKLPVLLEVIKDWRLKRK